jgi:hypothetical protein
MNILIILGGIALLSAIIATSYHTYKKRTLRTEISETSVTSVTSVKTVTKKPDPPIEKVNAYLKQDLGKKGYMDATVNPDDTLERQINKIKEDGKTICDDVIRQYENDIIELDADVNIRNRDGYLDIVERLKAQKQQYENDIKKVEEKKSVIENNEDLGIYASYRKGFDERLKAIMQANLLGKYNNNQEKKE